MTGDSTAGEFRSIIFDCDSTLVAIEGIDELAGRRAEEVRALTEAAMAGRVALEDVYGERLRHIRPTREQVEALGWRYIEQLVPDARETIAALQWLGKQVRILSGGLRPAVEILARSLGVGPEDVAAVGIDFDDTGAYLDFESDSQLARSGGKEAVIRAWNLPRPSLLVGDGATDAEASPAVDAFCAFTAIEDRPEVSARADYVIRSNSLADVLAIATGETDRERLAASHWSDLLARGEFP